MNKHPQSTPGDGGRRWNLFACSFLSLASHWKKFIYGKVNFPTCPGCFIWILGSCSGFQILKCVFHLGLGMAGKTKSLVNWLPRMGQ